MQINWQYRSCANLSALFLLPACALIKRGIILITWLSIHFNPTAAVHSFLAALLYQSRLYSLSSVFVISVILLRLGLTEKISPLELTFGWLFNNVSTHPLPDLCMDRIAKNLTPVHAHSSLANKQHSSESLITWKITEKSYHQAYHHQLPVIRAWRWVVHVRNFCV
jgi:hypothetical protein